MNFSYFWWIFFTNFGMTLLVNFFVTNFDNFFFWKFRNPSKLSPFSVSEFSPKLVTKKIRRNYCHQNWWHFLHSKTHQFHQITKIFTKIGDKKKQNWKELLSPELVTFLSLKNLPISSIHQKFQQNRWKIWQNSIEHYKSSKFSLKICENFGKNSFENECGFFKVMPPLSGSWK